MTTRRSTQLVPAGSSPVSLREGMRLVTGSRHLRLQKLHNGNVVLVEPSTQLCRPTTEGELIDAIHRGDVRVEANTSLEEDVKSVLSTEEQLRLRARVASPAAISRMVSKLRWLRALHTAGGSPIGDTEVFRVTWRRLKNNELAAEPAFTLKVLRQAELKLSRSQGDHLALLPNYTARGGRGRSRLPAHMETVIDDCITKTLSEQDAIVQFDEINKRVTNQLASANPAYRGSVMLLVPGESTIRRRIKDKVSAYELARRKSDRHSANRQFRNQPIRISAHRPLEVVEVDDTDMPLFLVDERLGLPYGHAFLTSSIDQCTRVPLGFQLGTQYRDANTAVATVLDGLLPKSPDRAEFGERARDWPGYGQPGEYLFDNATYNHARHTQSCLAKIDTVCGMAKPFAPTEKSVIEFFHARLKAGYVSTLAGYSGRKGDLEALQRGEASAVYPLHVFRYGLVTWFTGDYLNRDMDIGVSPKGLWRQHYGDHRPLVRWTREQLRIFRMIEHSNQLRDSGGLTINRLRYGGDELQRLRVRIGARESVRVFVDPDDLTSVLVRDPHSDAYLVVPCLEDPGYVDGLTLLQQQRIIKVSKYKKRRGSDMPALIQARDELRHLTAQQQYSNKLRVRRRGQLNHVPPLVSQTADATADAKAVDKTLRDQEVFVTELEDSIAQIDLTELDQEDSWVQA